MMEHNSGLLDFEFSKMMKTKEISENVFRSIFFFLSKTKDCKKLTNVFFYKTGIFEHKWLNCLLSIQDKS